MSHPLCYINHMMKNEIEIGQTLENGKLVVGISDCKRFWKLENTNGTTDWKLREDWEKHSILPNREGDWAGNPKYKLD